MVSGCPEVGCLGLASRSLMAGGALAAKLAFCRPGVGPVLAPPVVAIRLQSKNASLLVLIFPLWNCTAIVFVPATRRFLNAVRSITWNELSSISELAAWL